MHVNAHLGIKLVAVEQHDQITLLLELQAPEHDATVERPPSTVQVVLDRSGSMRGDRLGAARAALSALVDRLDPADRFGLVTFDHEADVVVPTAAVTDKPALKAAIAGVADGGSTNLSAGLLRWVQEARRAARAARAAGATLLLLSDGHANDGVIEPARLEAVARKVHEHGVVVSTVGIGLEYDELLLSAVARGGQGRPRPRRARRCCRGRRRRRGRRAAVENRASRVAPRQADRRRRAGGAAQRLAGPGRARRDHGRAR